MVLDLEDSTLEFLISQKVDKAGNENITARETSALHQAFEPGAFWSRRPQCELD